MSSARAMVISTRARRTDAGLAAEVEAAGFRLLSIPATRLRVRRGARARLRRLLASGRFDWIAVTSTTAAGMVAREWPARPIRQQRIGAIGPATAHALSRARLPVSVTPPRHTGQGLAAAILSAGTARRVLWPRAARTPSRLAAHLRRAGVIVVELSLYGRTSASKRRWRVCERALTSGRAAAICFFAPSGVAAAARALAAPARARMRQVCIASIGPTTTTALRAAGFRPDVESNEATSASLGRQVVRHLRSRRASRFEREGS